MPRIRYLKKKLEEITPVIIEEVENEDEKTLAEVEESGNNSPIWGREALRGWYNNANIIASLPASKIKTAISYHKEMLYILQQELLLRSGDDPRVSFQSNWPLLDDNQNLEQALREDFRQSRRDRGKAKKGKRTTLEAKLNKFCKILEAAKLPPEKIKELTQCLAESLTNAIK